MTKLFDVSFPEDVWSLRVMCVRAHTHTRWTAGLLTIISLEKANRSSALYAAKRQAKSLLWFYIEKREIGEHCGNWKR